MARPQRNDDPRSSRAARSKAPSLGPLVALGFLAILGILAAALIARNTKPAEVGATSANQPVADPFASLDIPEPEKVVRKPSSGPARKVLVDTAPAGLADNPVWIAALASAKQGDALVAEAKAAEAAGDTALYKSKAAAVCNHFNAILESVVDWESELNSKYPNDRQVASIKKEITRWFDVNKKFRAAAHANG